MDEKRLGKLGTNAKNKITKETFEGYKIETIDSGTEGPYVVILGGVHGNELSGIQNLELLSQYFATNELKKGKVLLITANTEAIEQKKRYVTGDLNRLFGNKLKENTGEFRIGKELAKYLSESNVVIDIHDTFTALGSGPMPFIFTDNEQLAKLVPDTIKFCIQQFDNQKNTKEALTEALKGETYGGTASERYAQLLGKQGICIEAGTFDQPNAELAFEIVQNILRYNKMIDGAHIDYGHKKTYSRDQFYVYNPDSFTFSGDIFEGKDLEAGEIIGHEIQKDGSKKEIRTDRRCKILFILNKYNYGTIRLVPNTVQKFSGYGLVNITE